MAQYYAPWLNAVHPRLYNVHQASVWLNVVHQTSIWLNALHQASIWLNLIIAQCCASSINVAVHHASLWLDAVHLWLNDAHLASV